MPLTDPENQDSHGVSVSISQQRNCKVKLKINRSYPDINEMRKLYNDWLSGKEPVELFKEQGTMLSSRFDSLDEEGLKENFKVSEDKRVCITLDIREGHVYRESVEEVANEELTSFYRAKNARSQTGLKSAPFFNKPVRKELAVVHETEQLQVVKTSDASDKVALDSNVACSMDASASALPINVTTPASDVANQFDQMDESSMITSIRSTSSVRSEESSTNVNSEAARNYQLLILSVGKRLLEALKQQTVGSQEIASVPTVSESEKELSVGVKAEEAASKRSATVHTSAGGSKRGRVLDEDEKLRREGLADLEKALYRPKPSSDTRVESKDCCESGSQIAECNILAEEQSKSDAGRRGNALNSRRKQSVEGSTDMEDIDMDLESVCSDLVFIELSDSQSSQTSEGQKVVLEKDSFSGKYSGRMFHGKPIASSFERRIIPLSRRISVSEDELPRDPRSLTSCLKTDFNLKLIPLYYRLSASKGHADGKYQDSCSENATELANSNERNSSSVKNDDIKRAGIRKNFACSKHIYEPESPDKHHDDLKSFLSLKQDFHRDNPSGSCSQESAFEHFTDESDRMDDIVNSEFHAGCNKDGKQKLRMTCKYWESQMQTHGKRKREDESIDGSEVNGSHVSSVSTINQSSYDSQELAYLRVCRERAVHAFHKILYRAARMDSAVDSNDLEMKKHVHKIHLHAKHFLDRYDDVEENESCDDIDRDPLI